MQTKVNVALDAMGGDFAPDETVKGAVEAVNENQDIKVILVGKSELIQEKLKQYSYNESQIEVVHAEDVITNDEAPVMAIRRKKESSIVVAMKLVKEGKADCFVSAGSTGVVSSAVQPLNILL